MLYGFLITLYVLSAIFLMLIILMQKGQNSMGIGSMGGGAQMLFGSSGGTDVFQKITWGLGAFFMTGSLVLGLMKVNAVNSSRFLTTPVAIAEQVPAPENPAETPVSIPVE